MKIALTFMVLLWQTTAFAQTGRGVVSGQIRNVDGQPAAGVRVALMEAAEGALTAKPSLSLFSETDALGRYRMQDIPPGRYVVAAGKAEFISSLEPYWRAITDAPTFFPGVKAALNASPIAIEAGAVLSGVDFAMRPPLGVSGRVEGLNRTSTTPGPVRSAWGIPLNPGLFVLLVPLSAPFSREEPDLSLAPVLTWEAIRTALSRAQKAESGPEGSFKVADIAPGVYLVWPFISTAPFPDPLDVAGLKTIVVRERDVTNVVTTLPQRIAGRVVVDQGGPAQPFDVLITDSAGLTFTAATTRDNAFQLTIPPGEYRVRFQGLTTGYFPRSIRYGGREALDAPLIIGTESEELVVHLGVSDPLPWVRVSGRLSDMGLPPDAPSTSLILADSKGTLFVSLLQRNGAFDFDRVLPGSYTAAVVPTASVAEIERAPTELRQPLLWTASRRGYSFTVVVGASDMTGLEIQLPVRQ
jgi:hypothetical protein